MDEQTFRSSDGVEIFYRRWAVPHAGAAVVIVHGASEHSARYERFALALNARGYNAFALDQRGHGRTIEHTGPGRMGGSGIDSMLDDIGALIAIAREEADRVVLFGHSMGSIMVHAFVERRTSPLAGLVLSGSLGVTETATQTAEALRAAVDGGLADEPFDVLGANNAAFEPGRTRYDWLSRDNAEVDKYIADPLCGDDVPLTYGFVFELLRGLGEIMTPAGIAAISRDLPVLLVTGERDPVSAQAAQVRVLETRLRDAGMRVDARYYPEARHELLNETNRDAVTGDIIDWLDETLAAQER